MRTDDCFDFFNILMLITSQGRDQIRGRFKVR